MRFLRGETSDLDHEREAVFNSLKAENSAHKHTHALDVERIAEQTRKAKWWERQAKGLGWTQETKV